MHKKATPRPFWLILLRAKLAATGALCDVLTLRHVTRTKVSSRSPCAAAKLHDILQKKKMTVRLAERQSKWLPCLKTMLFIFLTYVRFQIKESTTHL